MKDSMSVKSRVTALIATGALACAMMPAAAFAVEPSVGAQTGTGSTDVTVILNHSGEVGGNTDPNNPDGSDGDDYGDNVAFSVPSEINFVANAAGVLTGPSNAEIQNHSTFSIHTSSLDVDANGDWNVVETAGSSSETNAVEFHVGPATDKLNAYDYLTKSAVSTPSAWNMAANTGKVSMSANGQLNNVSSDISTKTKVATMKWYVTPGSAA